MIRIEQGHSMRECGDLYSREAETYVFLYGDETPSVAYYRIDQEEALALAEESRQHDGEYWGAFLGIGGHIIDGDAAILSAMQEWIGKECDCNDVQ